MLVPSGHADASIEPAESIERERLRMSWEDARECRKCLRVRANCQDLKTQCDSPDPRFCMCEYLVCGKCRQGGAYCQCDEPGFLIDKGDGEQAEINWLLD